MSEEMGTSGKMFGGVAASGPTKRLRRLALVVANSSASYAAAELRGVVETFVVETLGELRAALTAQFLKQYDEDAGKYDRFGSFLAIDITRLPIEDTLLFASEFGGTSQLGLVMVLTPQQFLAFEDGVFDFVVR